MLVLPNSVYRYLALIKLSIKRSKNAHTTDGVSYPPPINWLKSIDYTIKWGRKYLSLKVNWELHKKVLDQCFDKFQQICLSACTWKLIQRNLSKPGTITTFACVFEDSSLKTSNSNYLNTAGKYHIPVCYSLRIQQCRKHWIFSIMYNWTDHYVTRSSWVGYRQ